MTSRIFSAAKVQSSLCFVVVLAVSVSWKAPPLSNRASSALPIAPGDTPLNLVGKMWAGLVEWARAHLLASQPPLASPEDMAIPACVQTADEAIALIRGHHVRWLREQAAQS